MPRTCAYLSPFKSLLNGKSRREVMATGVALALAAPFSTVAATALPVDDADDWPEFHRWLKDAIALEAYYARTSLLSDTHDLALIRPRERYQNDEMGRLDEIADALAARPVKTEKQLAMLVTLVVWSSEHMAGGGGCFSVANIRDDGLFAESMNLRLLKVLALRAAQVLPEVPFVFANAKAEGSTNVL